ncbi:DNA topoisomerase I [Candidatus Woesearchaeota archaeon]|nr:MAG: DNA topoisomerase I [Candidatus Woesearchaeota archaeon]
MRLAVSLNLSHQWWVQRGRTTCKKYFLIITTVFANLYIIGIISAENMYELIITEKPKAAQKIADALSDGKPKKENINQVPVYRIKHDNKEIVVACAVGHIFGLAEKNGNKWSYPTFDIEWKPSFEIKKESAHTKKYYSVLKKLCKNADVFTVATDYDVEGEVIGLNVVRFICKQKDARRMKFSTLTKPDLVRAYDSAAQTLDWGQAKAGETRHILDWFYGINLSRALSHAIKKAGMFKILSSGRVQGPALKIIVEREKEIRAFKPEPYWQIELKGSVKNGSLMAWHLKDKFWDKKEADEVLKKTKGKEAVIEKIEKTSFQQKPPFPFDLTSLQTEAYRCFKISPKETLAIAQELYISGLISYPRTSSQQLPPAIGFKKILQGLAKQAKYKELSEMLLKKTKLVPNNGKKTDPAHPAIYPTGIAPKSLNEREQKIYALVVRRFLATFGEAATRETVKIVINCGQELFEAKGTRTTKEGWHIFYGPFAKMKEEEMPACEKGEKVDVKEINVYDKETEPPKRYTPASIIKELEKKNLGTKSTRAQIIDTLFARKYVTGSRSIEATDLGIRTVETLEKYCPKILDEELTRRFEEEMEDIRNQKKTEDDVIDEAKDVLLKILDDFKKKEESIGEDLIKATKDSERKEKTLGKCPNCENGMLMIKKGKFGRFAACSEHPNCKTTFSLPNNGIVTVSDKKCDSCSHPLITIKRRGKSPQEVCINTKCPKKDVDAVSEKPCPKCGGTLILRKSVYGTFYGCKSYPKCRHTEKINNGNNSK